ncbi:MAG: hypothetical protein FJ217_07500 [Ignavibacteria bacterium]|nr:hypothetical protein [Ignavibacteria bacterium]
MRRRVAAWIAILLLAASLQSAAQTSSHPGFIFLPFENKSSFTGRWDVGVDVPRFLSAYIKERYRIPTISPVIVRNFQQENQLPDRSLDDVKFWSEIYRRFEIRYLVAGTVEEFDISRFMTGQPLLGGYEAFKGEVNITYIVYDLDRTVSSGAPVWIKKGEAAGEFADRSLVLTLFGKQSERTLEYRDLDKITFGTEEFNRTVIGQACFQMSEHVSLDLESTLPSIKAWAMTSADSLLLYSQSLDSISLGFRSTTITGAVVFIEGKSAFINLGSEDGVRSKLRLYVYRDVDQTRTRVGELEVVDVRGPHLSLATVISAEKEIKAKDQVVVTIIR